MSAASSANPYLRRSWTACFAVLFDDPTCPPKFWEIDAAGYLFERGYHPRTIRRVLDHALFQGTVECCVELSFDDRDRERIEANLPDGHPSEWNRAEYAGTWSASA